MTLEEQLDHLQEMARRALGRWGLPEDCNVTLINVSENATYLIVSPDGRFVLRVHRPDYHSRRAIECELAWVEALRKEGVVETPPVLAGIDGAAIQVGCHPSLPESRFMVMFGFIEGTQPREGGDLVANFCDLGAIAARTHNHAERWRRPEPFERPSWNLQTIFGERPTWGRWRDAPNVTAEIAGLLGTAEDVVARRLRAFGVGADRYGLIHADMRLANLLVAPSGTRLIDFDDCGFGWFLYDFATGISFMEDHRQVPDLRAAWVEGYRTRRRLSDADEREIDSLVMLRRLALLAWIGSHIEAPEPQQLAPDFARVTADLAETYLGRFR
jgi:Ser/Thr protein kinase RdoA (MazF antagonist)